MYQSDILEVHFLPVVLAQLCSDKFSILYTGIRMAEEESCGCTCTLNLSSKTVFILGGNWKELCSKGDAIDYPTPCSRALLIPPQPSY
jgi:hypothetical protein